MSQEHMRIDEDGSRATATNEREITIGASTILLPLAMILVVAGGWMVGRWIGGRGAADISPMTAQQQSAAPQQDAQSQASQLGAQQQVIIVPTPAGMAGIPDDLVMPLPERFHPMVGQEAPDFTLTLLETGEEVNLSDYRGRPLLVNFWATWCPPCRLEMPFLQNVHDDYADQGFAVLAVDAGEKVPPSMVVDTITRYVNSAGLTFPILYGDSVYDIQRDWTVLGLPGSFLVDENGIVRAYHSGMYPNTATLEAHVLEHLPILAGGSSIDAEGSADG